MLDETQNADGKAATLRWSDLTPPALPERSTTPTTGRPNGPNRPSRNQPAPRRRVAVWSLSLGTALVLSVGLGVGAWNALHANPPVEALKAPDSKKLAPSETASPGLVAMPEHQQHLLGLEFERAASGTSSESLTAPGRIAADQKHFAFITPRARGVVRSVEVNIGQEVHAGDVLATIESPEVGQARINLRTQSQLLKLAQARADWQQTVYDNTLALMECLNQGDEPDLIRKKMKGRPIGVGRGRLMSAYAQVRMTSASMDRNQHLVKERAVSVELFQQARAAHEAASASYQSILESTEYEARLANIAARQDLSKAETAVGVAKESLKILGVGSDLEDVENPNASPDDASPLSTYNLVAPFDGTVLNRELVVPGISVDLTSRLFTIADLSMVWLEVNVSENDFDTLARTQNGEVHFTSPAYPGHDFTGRVIYEGDLVDEASRTVKLLAATDNPDRLLKPGMFIEVSIRCPNGLTAARVPDSAIVADGEENFLFVKTGHEHFERRKVLPGDSASGLVSVVEGLKPGEEVVVQGASKLEAKALANRREG